MDFWKGRQRQKKQNRKNINSLRQAFCGNKIDKKPVKMQGNKPFRAIVYKTEAQKHRETKKTKPPKPKKGPKKNTFVHSGKPPLFLFFFFALSCLQSCVLLKTL